MTPRVKLWAVLAAVAVAVAAVSLVLTLRHDPTMPTAVVEAGSNPVLTDSEGN